MANAGCFKKGEKRPNQGKRGPSKATLEFRQTVQALLDENADNVSKWLSMVANGHSGAEPAPEKALDILHKLAEYAAPKLARTEHVGDNGGPVRIVATQLDEKL